MRGVDSDMTQVFKLARKQGCVVEPTANGHYRITVPGPYPHIIAAGSASDVRAVKNLKANLRRFGISTDTDEVQQIVKQRRTTAKLFRNKYSESPCREVVEDIQKQAWGELFPAQAQAVSWLLAHVEASGEAEMAEADFGLMLPLLVEEMGCSCGEMDSDDVVALASHCYDGVNGYRWGHAPLIGKQVRQPVSAVSDLRPEMVQPCPYLDCEFTWIEGHVHTAIKHVYEDHKMALCSSCMELFGLDATHECAVRAAHPSSAPVAEVIPIAMPSRAAPDAADAPDETEPDTEPEFAPATSLPALQAEIGAWAVKFRDTPDAPPNLLADACAVAEEAGEVCRAAVKLHHGQRPDIDWQEQLRSEVGDVLITLASLAENQGWDLLDVLADRWDEVRKR